MKMQGSFQPDIFIVLIVGLPALPKKLRIQDKPKQVCETVTDEYNGDVFQTGIGHHKTRLFRADSFQQSVQKGVLRSQ